MPGTPRSHRPTPSPELVAYIDGGSRGNPGPAGYGVVIQDAQGRQIDTLSRFLGHATNNVAEYEALLAALEYASQRQSKSLKIYSDSELITRQMQGRYRVQSLDLRPLYEHARQLAARLPYFSIQHVPREQNRLADRLANQAMDRGREQGKVPSPPQTLRFVAVVEGGRLKPLGTLPELQEGAEYEIRAIRRRASRQGN